MMTFEKFEIGRIPALIYGETSSKGYLFVHGKSGCKEEGEAFAEIVCPKGFQVISIDLPGHGEREKELNQFDPWHAVPELKQVMDFAKRKWRDISLRANSIGAWFSMLALSDEKLAQSLFVSPILDMERLIIRMMQWATVTEEELQKRNTIATSFGETLSWKYLQYAKKHQISKWESPTAILYAGQDNLTERDTVYAFADRFHADLTVMENGEHWFHTVEQVKVLEDWTRRMTEESTESQAQDN